MRFDGKNPYQMNYPDFGGFNLGHALGGFVRGLGHDGGALVNAISHGDVAATANSLADVTNSAIGTPGTHTGLALLTGQDPLEAAKRDMIAFQAAAGGQLSNFSNALQNGTAQQVFNAATNFGALRDSGLPLPPGVQWPTSARDITGLAPDVRRRILAAEHPIMALHASQPLLAAQAGLYAHHFHSNLGAYPVAPPTPPVAPPAPAVGTVPGTSPPDAQLAMHSPHKGRTLWEWIALGLGGAAAVAGGVHLVKKHR
jgi:hypothetical protein